jgi:hypothetical protein
MIPLFALIALVAISLTPLVWPRQAGRCDRFELLYMVVVMLAIVVWRLPAILIVGEINVDESQTIAQCMAFYHDPMPWRSADTTTSGPLNTYVYMWPYLFSHSPTYASLRWTTIGLITVTLFCLRRFTATVLTHDLSYASLLPLLLHYCLNMHPDFLHASTENLPTAMLAMATLLVTPIWRRKAAIWQLVACGVLLGGMPIAKMQAALPAAMLLLILVVRVGFDLSRPALQQVTLLISGSLAPIAILAFTVCIGGVFDQMINRYFIRLITFTAPPAVPMPWQQRLLAIFFSGHFFGYYCLWTAALVVVALFKYFRHEQRCSRYTLGIILATILLDGSTVVAILRSGNFCPHYATLAIVPLSVTHVLLLWIVTRHDYAFRKYYWILFVCLALAIPAMSIPASLAGRSRLLRSASASSESDTMVKIIIEQTPAGEMLGIWGWTPGYFVATSTRSATRDLVSFDLLQPHSQQDWYRRIYYEDLKRNRPYLFLDTATDVTPCPEFPPVPLRRHTCDHSIRAFISAHYEKIAEYIPAGYKTAFWLYRRKTGPCDKTKRNITNPE